MSNNQNSKDYTKIAANVFILSVLLFVISLIPAAYFVGSSFLIGGAGVDPIPVNPTAPPVTTSSWPIERGLSILSGIVAVVSGAYSVQKVRSEISGQKLALRTKELDREMQLREVEILKLELELEKHKSKKKPSKRSSTSKNIVKTSQHNSRIRKGK